MIEGWLCGGDVDKYSKYLSPVFQIIYFLLLHPLIFLTLIFLYKLWPLSHI